MRLLTVLVIYTRFEKFKIQHIQKKSRFLLGKYPRIALKKVYVINIDSKDQNDQNISLKR